MKAQQEASLREGSNLAPWCIVAENDAKDAPNPIHDDAVARSMGFSGGLVPGVTIFGYMTHPLVAVFGKSFLEIGHMDIHLRRPIYEGDRITVCSKVTRKNSHGVIVDVKVSDSSQEICAVGTATFEPKGMPLPEDIPSLAQLPDSLPPVSREILDNHRLLGTIEACFNPVHTDRYLRGLGEDLPIYRNEVVHPAWLLRHANLVLDRNVTLGPWIHVSSAVQFFGTVAPGEIFSTRACVKDLFERKGHEYVDLDVVLITTCPVMRVRHRAIYKMADGGV